MKSKYQDKARGMMVGLAVGDALGAPVEFLPEPSDVYIKEMGDKIKHFHNIKSHNIVIARTASWIMFITHLFICK